MNKNFEQYVSRYAEEEARALLALADSHATLQQHVAGRALTVIPLCDEAEQIADCLAAIEKAATRDPAFVIFVVNNRSAARDHLIQNNEKTFRFLWEATSKREQVLPGIWLGALGDSLSLLLIDRYSEGHALPEDQGVGLARKVGCDVAVVLSHLGRTSDGFIRNTDGDARVPLNFFQPIPTGPAASLFAFTHDAKGDGIDAVLQYEAYLHYYVRGLQAAGSSYAFHSIGSTIASSVDAYIAARGFPRKEAGEDFYLLNKLAKLGSVKTLPERVITLVARDSGRVPFGTGAACRKIEGLIASGGEYRVYHPDSFRLLKLWLDSLQTGINSHLESNVWPSFVEQSTRSFSLPEAAYDAFDRQLGLQSGLAVVGKSSKLTKARQEHARVWFDGFKTMRFLNLSRELCFGDIPVNQCAGLFGSD